jgi:glycosyltransferase involved in cell wall biosynthesis
MNILIISRIITPYRLAWFEELGKTNKLTVLYTRDNDLYNQQPWKWQNPINFNLFKLKSLKLLNKEISFQVFKYLQKNNQIVLFDGYAPLTNVVGIIYLIIGKKKYYVNIDGLLQQRKNLFKKNIKKFLLKNAYILCSSNYTKKQLLALGLKEKKCHIHNFTSLTKSEILTTPLTRIEKNNIRKKLGIHENTMMLSVGQIIHRKGYDILLKAVSKIDAQVGIYIIGGKATKSLIRFQNKYKLNNIHFIDFVDKNNLNYYYSAADFFVLPTRYDIWGLVINEAMAKGLPIITTNRCGAGIELIKEGVNGYIVKAEDVKMLREKIIKLIDKKSCLEKMGKASLESICNYTIENMVIRHNEVFSQYNQK